MHCVIQSPQNIIPKVTRKESRRRINNKRTIPRQFRGSNQGKPGNYIRKICEILGRSFGIFVAQILHKTLIYPHFRHDSRCGKNAMNIERKDPSAHHSAPTQKKQMVRKLAPIKKTKKVVRKRATSAATFQRIYSAETLKILLSLV